METLMGKNILIVGATGGIGAAVTRIDGPLKVTGGAKSASDMTVTNPAYAYFHTSAIAWEPSSILTRVTPAYCPA